MSKVNIKWNDKDFRRWARNDCDVGLVAGYTEQIAEKAGPGFSAMTSNAGNRTRGYVATATTEGRLEQARHHAIERAIGSSGL